MRAVVHERYGPPEVLRLEEVERPVPKDDEVLVKIHATTVTRTDCRPSQRRIFPQPLRHRSPPPKRKILGMELAGEVEAVGAAVTEFAVGDEVFGVKESGAHAEFVCVPESAALAHKPAGTTFAEAAAVCDGASLALACLRNADLRKGRSILVYGASGSVGTAGVQLAKYFGADVTAVCNTKNLELVASLGADSVVDYTEEDFTKNGETYDVIFDAVGKQSFRRCRRSLKPGGIYTKPTWGSCGTSCPGLVDEVDRRQEGAARDHQVHEAGRPLPQGAHRGGALPGGDDRTYPLEQVIEATKYVETEQKTGNVVLTVSGDPP